MSEMMCHLCYTKVSSYRLTDHMRDFHFQDRKQLTPLEMADLETVAAYADVQTFRRMMTWCVVSVLVGAAILLWGGFFATVDPVIQVFNGVEYPYAPIYAIAMIWVGGAFGVIGVAGMVWFLSWAMKGNIWGRYRAVQHRWTQLQNKEQ